MGGAILISRKDSRGLSMSSGAFDFIVKCLRPVLVEMDPDLANDVYDAMDGGGTALLSVNSLDDSEFKTFRAAVEATYKAEVARDPGMNSKQVWEEFLKQLSLDDRAR